MRERKLTRHDIGREQFVCQVSSSYDLTRTSKFLKFQLSCTYFLASLFGCEGLELEREVRWDHIATTTPFRCLLGLVP